MQWSGNADVQMGAIKAIGFGFVISLPVSAWVCKFKNVLLILILEENGQFCSWERSNGMAYSMHAEIIGN